MSGSGSPSRHGRGRGVAVGVGLVLALAMFVLRIAGGDLPWSTSLPGAIAFSAIVAVPPILASLADTNAPDLYLAAGVSSIVLSLGLSVLIVVMVPLGIVWFWVFAREQPQHGWRAAAAAVAATVLAIAGFLVLFVHLDPVCLTTYRDGRTFLAPGPGSGSGWAWDVAGGSSGSHVVDADVVSVSCSSDVVTWLESLVSLALSASSVAGAFVIARPRGHPTTDVQSP